MGNFFEFDEKVIAIGLKAGDWEAALRQVARLLYNAGYVKETYTAAIIQRERSFPTGLPTGENGVAIPHTDICHVKAPMIAVGTFQDPVPFQNMGGTEEPVPVRLMFMLAMQQSDNQVRLLSQLMQIIQDQTLLEQLCAAKSVAHIRHLLNGRIQL